MSKSNKERARQLGMSHGSACNKLRKQIMFRMMQKCGEDICFQCGEKIESVDTLSVEHKIPWMNSNDPVGLFFDTDNIAFSHLSCNCRAYNKDSAIPCPSRAAYRRGCRCKECRKINSRYQKEWRENRNGDHPAG